MDRRTVLAMVLSFAVIWGWQKYYIEPRMPKRPAPQATSQQQPDVPKATLDSAKEVAQATPAARKPLETKSIALPNGTAILGNGSQVLTGWDLKSYKKVGNPEAANQALNLESVTQQQGSVELGFDLPELAYLSQVQGELSSSPQGVLWKFEDENVRIVREVTGGQDKHYLDLRVTTEFKTRKPGYLFVWLTGKGSADDPEAADRQLQYFTKGSLERIQVEEGIETKNILTDVDWIGVSNRYFLLSLVNAGAPVPPKALVQGVGPYTGRVSLVYPIQGNSITVPLKLYFGPKELNALRSVDPKLDHAVDFGWFTWFAYPLLQIMKWFYGLVKNYGIAIILLTLLVKLVTYPLTYKSMKSMKEMAKIQPQLQAVREKYKDDREALNRETLNLMRTHGYNPMAGCLPILVQMPIFFALYRVLYSSIELYQAPFVAWITDLSTKDPYYVTPILLTLTMYIQQKLTPNTATDPVQAKMIQFMPVIFGVMMISLPSGLTLYMLVNALASIVQQLILNKKLGIGNAAPVTARAR